jgi:predicted transcriptional regulator
MAYRKKHETIYELLLRVSAKLLPELDNNNILQSAKNTGIAYDYCHKLAIIFAKNHLIMIEKKGRENICRVTQKGQKIINKICEINRILNQDESQL